MTRIQTINSCGKTWVSIEEVRTATKSRSSLTSLTVEDTSATLRTILKVPSVLTFNWFGTVLYLNAHLDYVENNG